jgi:hypothetical protein
MLLDVYVVYLMQIFLVCWMQVFFCVIVMEKCVVVSRGVERSFISVSDFGRWILLHRQHDRKDGPHFGEVFSHSLILVK